MFEINPREGEEEERHQTFIFSSGEFDKYANVRACISSQVLMDCRAT